MPHVAFVPMSGFRIREQEMLALGMSLPGLRARQRAIGQLPALGLLTLAGILPDDWSCSYHATEQVTDELVQTLVSERPDFVAISALTASILEAYELTRRLRAEGLTTVIGGLHATACPDEVIAHGATVVTGSAETVWPTLLRDARLHQLRPRYDAVDSQDSANSLRSESPSIPRWNLLGTPPARFTLQTQRGCPFACDFCGASRLLGRFREKPVSHIRAELEAIQRRSRRPLIELADDNTFAGPRDPQPLLDALADSHARWFTESDWRIGERTDILKRLAQSGCVQLLIGIESLEFRFPGMGAKQAELPRILRAIEAIQDAGIAVNGCFILGADGETRASIDRLVAFLLDSPFADVQLTLQTPFPGTGLHERLRHSGRLLPDRDWSFHTLFDVTYQPDGLSVAELESAFRDAVRTVFSSVACRRRDDLRQQIWSRRFRVDTRQNETSWTGEPIVG